MSLNRTTTVVFFRGGLGYIVVMRGEKKRERENGRDDENDKELRLERETET